MKQLLTLSLLTACACSEAPTRQAEPTPPPAAAQIGVPGPPKTPRKKPQSPLPEPGAPIPWALRSISVRVTDYTHRLAPGALAAVVQDFNARYQAQGLEAKLILHPGRISEPDDVQFRVAGRKNPTHWLEKHRELALSDFLRPVDALWADEALAQSLKSTAEIVQDRGHYYGLPFAYDPQGLYFNTALFARLKLSPPKRWAELLKLCETLKAEGITPIAFAAKDALARRYLFEALLLAEGGDDALSAFTRDQLPYTAPALSAALSKWTQLKDAGCLSEDANRLRTKQALALLAKGRAAMTLAAPAYIPKKLRDALSYIPFPAVTAEGSAPTHPVAAALLVASIPKASQYARGAAAFLAYLSLPEVQVKLSEASKELFPARADAHPKDPLLKNTQAVLSTDPTVRVYLALHTGAEDKEPRRELNHALRAFSLHPDRQQAIQAHLEALRQARRK